jgi:hypothetical protein
MYNRTKLTTVSAAIEVGNYFGQSFLTTDYGVLRTIHTSNHSMTLDTEFLRYRFVLSLTLVTLISLLHFVHSIIQFQTTKNSSER